jgi:succinoglycan biosynthesis transport protein ExoP
VLANYQANPLLGGFGDLSDRQGAWPPAAPKVRVLPSIWRRRRLVIFFTALALLPAVLYVQLVKPLYTSNSKLLFGTTAVGQSGDTPSANSSSSQQQAAEDSLDDVPLAAQRDIVCSTPVLAVALATPGVRDCDPIRDHHDAIEFLKRSLGVETTGSSLMNVSIASPSPDEATCIVSAVVESYMQFLTSTRHKGSDEALAALQTAKAAAQAELAAKSADLLRFGEEHHVGVGDDNTGSGAAELESLAEAVNEAHVAAVGAKAANDALDRAMALDPQRAQALKWFEESSPASKNAETDDEELIRRELLVLKTRQAELQQKFMAGYPPLVHIQQRIDDLNLEHDASIQRRAATAAQREADMQRAYDDEQKRLLDQSAQRMQYSSRNAEVVALQNRVNDIDRHIGSVDAATSSNLPTVTLLEPARASLEPTSPNRRRILPTAAAAGFVLGCLLAFWLELSGAAQAASAGTKLHLPILAELPMLPTDFGPTGRGQRLLLNGGPILDESFAGLGNVLEGARMRGRGVIALITSPSRGDGKSTLASNLAVYLAHTHKRVLLVDADLRTPAQAKIFAVQDVTGLVTLLEAEVSIPITAIHHTSTPSLDIVPSGPLPENTAEMLNTQRFTDLLGDLAERYDYVLIDSPATVTFTDARTISASADLTLMVIRADQLNRRMFQMACDGLTNVGANLCGVVLNTGMADMRADSLTNDAATGGLPGPHPSALPPKRTLSNLIRAFARAVDLVRAPTTPPAGRNPLIANGHIAVPQNRGKLVSSGTPADDAMKNSL